jgi:hypothetical protein
LATIAGTPGIRARMFGLSWPDEYERTVQNESPLLEDFCKAAVEIGNDVAQIEEIVARPQCDGRA